MAASFRLTDILPPFDQGYLPFYLFVVSVTALGNAVQNFKTLHYSRRIYTGLFVPNPSLAKAKTTGLASGEKNPEDSVDKLVPASSTGKNIEKASDQLTPLAARLFGTWTFITGLVRLYTAYDVSNPTLYQLSLITHLIAASHYLSELLVYKTCTPRFPLVFPIAAGSTGAIWMAMQYTYYVGPIPLPPWLK